MWQTGPRHRENFPGDDPPHSRLFILASRDLEEKDIRDAFCQFGYIKNVWCVKDKQTGENKGIFYVQFSKTSDAAKAMEDMRGKFINNRSVKVMIASSRQQGSKKDDNEEEDLKRLFIIVPKTATDSNLNEYFQRFGKLEYANIVKNKETGQNKGFAYVKFTKFSDAAVAFENCDEGYKAVFAEPRKPREDLNKPRFQNEYIESQNHHCQSNVPPTNFQPDGVYKLSVITDPNVNQDQIWKLFDILPSMDYCQVLSNERNRNIFEVIYTNREWGMYALEKFHGFEYPPGNRLIVKAEDDLGTLNLSRRAPKRPISSYPASSTSEPSEIMQLAETIAKASSLLQKKAVLSDLLNSKIGSSQVDEDLSNRLLPPRQPLANIDAVPESTCFVVCTPTPLSNTVLQDLFRRFGNLIDAYMLHNRNYGYAKFTDKKSAEEAIKTLHGAEIQGIRLKVEEAREPGAKRRKESFKLEDTNN